MRAGPVCRGLALGLALCLPLGAAAAPADVIAVEITPEPGGTYRFDVTVRSDDTGWDKYADLWQVLTPEGALLGERELLHPHETEQPFTRSLPGVILPGEVTSVRLRARDSVEGWGGAEMTVPVPGR